MRMTGRGLFGASAAGKTGPSGASLGMLVLGVSLVAASCGGKPPRASLPAPEYERPALVPWHPPGVAEAGRGEPVDARTREEPGPVGASSAAVTTEVQPVDAGLGTSIGSERP